MHRLFTTGILITFGLFIICIITGCGDDQPEKATDSPLPEDDVPPPPIITVMVHPAPESAVSFYSNTEFTLTFNEEVLAAWLNDEPARGSGRKWRVSPALSTGPGQTLTIKWVRPDGSVDTIEVGPYNIFDNGGGDPPLIVTATVADGTADVDPAPINAGGLWVVFDENVTGTIRLTDEAGNDLNWVGIVQGENAKLTPVAGQELVHETTYKIEINVQDGSGNRIQATITFVTKPKE